MLSVKMVAVRWEMVVVSMLPIASRRERERECVCVCVCVCVENTQSFRAFLLFPEQQITKNCQQNISVVGEGFVETPGYPQFNVESNCTWKLRAQEGQRVKVSILDISLRGNYRN